MEVSLPRVWESMAKEQQRYSKENDGLAVKSKTRFLIDELISNKSPPRPRDRPRREGSPLRPTEADADEPSKGSFRRSPQIYDLRLNAPSDNSKRPASPLNEPPPLLPPSVAALPLSLPPPPHSHSRNRGSPFPPLLSPQPMTAATVPSSMPPVLHAWNGHPQYGQHVVSAFAHQNHFPFVQRFLTPEQQQSMAWMASQSFNERLHSRFLASVPYPSPAYGHEGNGFSPFPGALHRQKRIRTAFTPMQQMELEKAFQANKYMVGEERKQLAKRLQLTETQIKVWFQNRRTKTRRTDQTNEPTDPKAAHAQSTSGVPGIRGGFKTNQSSSGRGEPGFSESSDESQTGEASDRPTEEGFDYDDDDEEEEEGEEGEGELEGGR